MTGRREQLLQIMKDVDPRPRGKLLAEIERLRSERDLFQRQLNKVDEALKWEYTGECRIERIWRALAAEAEVAKLRGALEAVEAEILLTGQLADLVSAALAQPKEGQADAAQ